MQSRRKSYPFDQFEPALQEFWAKTARFRVANPGEPGFDGSKPKYYVLDMFPYPSGDGLHVGHPEGYTATDIVARYKRMCGFNVLHPMGWDAFGLPAEQYAIKTGQHPRITTERNTAKFRSQLERIGFCYDWSREINTTEPGYFKWTQWIFLQLYGSWFDAEQQKARPIAELEQLRAASHPDESVAERRVFIDSMRLAYVSEMPVNWCPGLGTVLANEEVIDGNSEVGGFPVERRPMRQWMLRITAYAERLINELDGLDWPESIKALQRNWIGRSEGAMVQFQVAGSDASIEVFTTRPDTLFGATYMVLAPEHPLVDQIVTPENAAAVADYRRVVGSKSDLERTDLAKDKSGVFTGAAAINPVNGEQIPIWIADYVLMGYGTGAIMAVPAHDERDFEFAQKFALPVIEVVQPPLAVEGCFAGEGVNVNSGFLDGLSTAEAKSRMIGFLVENRCGRGTVNYKLRDWLFSRQRYWGEPFPIIWEDGMHRAVSETELPVCPPEMEDFKPAGTAEPPLSRATDWVKYSETARRETNTMPQWAGSCWYFLRYCDPQNADRFVSEAAEKYWMDGGIDLYVGGAEHATLHLLYARFWQKVLHDLGHVSNAEPCRKLVNQGLILGEDGQKMSKSRGNVVNPDVVIAEYGADAFRLYEMFMGPLEQVKPWSMSGVEGVARFLARVWRLMMEENQAGEWVLSSKVAEVEPTRSQLRIQHATVAKVTQDIDALSFNTAISQMMVCTNELTSAEQRPVAVLKALLQVLNPFSPHLSEELWNVLGQKFSGFDGCITDEPWPQFDAGLLIDDEIEIVLQINGKLRDKIRISKDLPAADVEAAAMANEKIVAGIDGKTVRKVIVVPSKLVNVVAS